MNVLLPIMECPAEHWAAIRGIFMDIDDTITTESRLTSDVFLAIEKLTAAGLSVVPITGRPAGWCDMIARMWPVDAVIGENGAFYFRPDRQAIRYWLQRVMRAPHTTVMTMPLGSQVSCPTGSRRA